MFTHPRQLKLYFIAGLSVANLEDGEVRVDEGGNLTLPCVEAIETEVEDYRVYWVHEGRAIDATVLDNDSLFLEHMRREDAGSYKCIEVDTDRTLSQVKVLVRSEFIYVAFSVDFWILKWTILSLKTT